jgi:hypothetical protein
MLTTPSHCGLLILQLLSSLVLPFLPSSPSSPKIFELTLSSLLFEIVRPLAVPLDSPPLLAALLLVVRSYWAPAVIGRLSPRLVPAVAPIPSVGQRWAAQPSSVCLAVGLLGFFRF